MLQGISPVPVHGSFFFTLLTRKKAPHETGVPSASQTAPVPANTAQTQTQPPLASTEATQTVIAPSSGTQTCPAPVVVVGTQTAPGSGTSATQTMPTPASTSGTQTGHEKAPEPVATQTASDAGALDREREKRVAWEQEQLTKLPFRT